MGRLYDLFGQHNAVGRFVCVSITPKPWEKAPEPPPSSEEKPRSNEEPKKQEYKLRLWDENTPRLHPTQRGYLFEILEGAAEHVGAYVLNHAGFIDYPGLFEDLCLRIRDLIRKRQDEYERKRKENPETPIPVPPLVILHLNVGENAELSDRLRRFAFETCEADAVIILPMLGYKANEPFLRHSDHGAFFVCRTSDPEADAIQGLSVGRRRKMTFAEEIALSIARDWNGNENCGLVMDATHPDVIRTIRRHAKGVPLLITDTFGEQDALQRTTWAVGDKTPFVVDISYDISCYPSGDSPSAKEAVERLRLTNEAIQSLLGKTESMNKAG